MSFRYEQPAQYAPLFRLFVSRKNQEKEGNIVSDIILPSITTPILPDALLYLGHGYRHHTLTSIVAQQKGVWYFQHWRIVDPLQRVSELHSRTARDSIGLYQHQVWYTHHSLGTMEIEPRFLYTHILHFGKNSTDTENYESALEVYFMLKTTAWQILRN